MSRSWISRRGARVMWLVVRVVPSRRPCCPMPSHRPSTRPMFLDLASCVSAFALHCLTSSPSCLAVTKLAKKLRGQAASRRASIESLVESLDEPRSSLEYLGAPRSRRASMELVTGVLRQEEVLADEMRVLDAELHEAIAAAQKWHKKQQVHWARGVAFHTRPLFLSSSEPPPPCISLLLSPHHFSPHRKPLADSPLR